MIAPTKSVLVKLGFHRIGLLLAILFASPIIIFGVGAAPDRAKLDEHRFRILRCVDKRMTPDFDLDSWINYRKQLDLSQQIRIDQRASITTGVLSPNDIPGFGETGLINVDAMGCGDQAGFASLETIRASRLGFNYSTTLNAIIARTMATALGVGLACYCSVLAMLWIVRGFLPD